MACDRNKRFERWDFESLDQIKKVANYIKLSAFMGVDLRFPYQSKIYARSL